MTDARIEAVEQANHLAKRLKRCDVVTLVTYGCGSISTQRLSLSKYQIDLIVAALAAADRVAGEEEVTSEIVTAAMREFEKYAARLLRYPEKDRWHTNDVAGMREALRVAFALARVSRTDDGEKTAGG